MSWRQVLMLWARYVPTPVSASAPLSLSPRRGECERVCRPSAARRRRLSIFSVVCCSVKLFLASLIHKHVWP